MSTAPPARWGTPSRINGLQEPLSRDQVLAAAIYPILSAAFYIIGAYFLPKDMVRTVPSHFFVLRQLDCLT